MAHQLRAKVFSDTGVVEGILRNYWNSPDLITVCMDNIVLTLPIEACTRICVFPEEIEKTVRETQKITKQIPLFEERPAS